MTIIFISQKMENINVVGEIGLVEEFDGSSQLAVELPHPEVVSQHQQQTAHEQELPRDQLVDLSSESPCSQDGEPDVDVVFEVGQGGAKDLT